MTMIGLLGVLNAAWATEIREFADAFTLPVYDSILDPIMMISHSIFEDSRPTSFPADVHSQVYN